MKRSQVARCGRLMLVILLVNVFVLNFVQAQGDSRTVRIGVLDSMDGAITKGAELAVWQINESGGIQASDGSIIHLELVVRVAAPGEALANAINSFSATDVVAVLGPEETEDVLSNMAVLQSLNVPVLTPAIGDTVIASDPTGMIIRTRAAERLQGAALADVLVNDLGVQRISTVQLDSASTGGRVGLSVALDGFNPGPEETALLLQTGQTIDDLVAEIMIGNPSVLVAFGPPDIASDLYMWLRAAGWMGTFAYNHADDIAFRSAVSRSDLNGILGTTTWSLSGTDDQSTAFLNSYVRAFGSVPGPIEAATYDSVFMIAASLQEPGPLAANLAAIRDVPGAQGLLNVSGLAAGEVSNAVAVIRLNAFGGVDTVARYAGSARLPDDGSVVVVDNTIRSTATPRPTFTPPPTATPEGVVLTILSAVQNVRTGPGLDYDILGQLRQGEQVQIIGATVDFSWVVVQFRGQQGWLATYLLEVFGDRSTVPVLAIPPTPTPGPPTATPLPPPIPDVQIVNAMPTNITMGVPTNIMVTVANTGGAAAGPFSIAATFPPDNTYSSANIAGLAIGAQQIVALPVTLSAQTGNFNVTLVADLNNEVAESAEGEANNDDYVFSFHLDRQTILTNTTSLAAGAYIDLEGNAVPILDLQYTAAGLVTANPACTATTDCIGLFTAPSTWGTVHYDQIVGAQGVNTTFVANASLTPGQVVGILTAEGRRAVLRVESITPGSLITFTYRVYQ